MPNQGQLLRWKENQFRVDLFVGKTVKEFAFSDAERDERLTIFFTDGTALEITSRIIPQSTKTWLIPVAHGQDSAPIRERKVIIK